MKRLMIICPVFREKRFCQRWHLLTQLYDDVDVTLLAPYTWTWKTGGGYSFGKDFSWEGEAWEDRRFRVRLVDMRELRGIGWLSWGMIHEIRVCKPDLIYFIGNELERALLEIIFVKWIFSPSSKVAAFTMRGLPYQVHNNPAAYIVGNKKEGCSQWVTSLKWSLMRLDGFLKWHLVKRCLSALFCHYPDARRLIMQEGFSKPVYIQTQIGVDCKMYMRDETKRKIIREKYNLGDAFVFGSATRLALEKGVIEILRALPKEGNWKYLMLGSGPKGEEEQIRAEVDALELSDKVILPGLIGWQEMSAYWSAMDCMIHVPRTTPAWVDTFPVAVVQAMASSLPIIGNTSGAVPYQLGGEGIVVPEGDIGALNAAICDMLKNPARATEMGLRLRQRALTTFDIQHLSHCYHSTMMDILDGVFDEAKTDQVKFAHGKAPLCVL